MTEIQVRALAKAALGLWAARAVNGSDDDADRAFLHEVTQIIVATGGE